MVLKMETSIHILCFLYYIVMLVGSTLSIDVPSKLMGRMIYRDSFKIRSRVSDGSTLHQIVVAVKQKNLYKLMKEVESRSSPRSPLYQSWLSHNEVTRMTSNPEATNAVKDYFFKFVPGVRIVNESLRGDYLRVEAPVSSLENLLSTTFYHWEDMSSAAPKKFIRAKTYSLPTSISNHVAAIFEVVQPPPIISKKYAHSEENHRHLQTRRQPLSPSKPTAPQKKTVVVNPPFLSNLYSIRGPLARGSVNMTQAVFETSFQYFSVSDLHDFQATFNLSRSTPIDIGGYEIIPGDNCTIMSDPGVSSLMPWQVKNCNEGNLDVQYIMSTAQDVATTYWYVDGDAVDAFVQFVTDVSNSQNPPRVLSISWGTQEAMMDPQMMDSFNQEALRLSAMGVTIVVAAGDDGVAGSGCSCVSWAPVSFSNCACRQNSSSTQVQFPVKNQYGWSWSGRGYFPSFPASSPYVISVGATMGPEKGEPMVVAQADKGGIVTSGGGFSTFFPRPAYQNASVNAYFASIARGETPRPAPGYNAKGRAYPDVSIIGVRYRTYISGRFMFAYGTSAATPVFAGMISLVNSARQKRGLSTVGFINPTIYNPENSIKFQDITKGANNCCANYLYPSPGICCTSGFTAARGFDPISGLGNINFPNLLRIFLPPTPAETPSRSLVDST